jgi:GTPase involved in cell partitioning and DNA repair
MKELNNYSSILASKKKVVGISKADLMTQNDRNKLEIDAKEIFNEYFIIFSAVSGYNINELNDFIWKHLQE